MKNPFMLTTCALMCAGLVFTSTGCKKITNSGGTITIKGRLIQDCSGMPVARIPLDFYLSSHNTIIGGQSGIIGHTTTDLEGNFTVTGTNYGGGGLSIYENFNDPTATRFVYNYGIDGGDGTVVDLGTVYHQYDVALSVKFARPINSLTDTLYFGKYSSNPYGVVVGSNIDGYVYYASARLNGEDLPYSESKKWVWGIGLADYKKAVDSMEALKNTSNPQYYHLINVRPGICISDTTFVNL